MLQARDRFCFGTLLGIVDRVFARIGASDNLVQHQSTFMSEMLETAFILAQASNKSLVVVDEVGMANYRVVCYFTSHFIQLNNVISVTQ